MTSVSVVVVTYNSANIIERCLNPLVKNVGKDIEIIVWDNNSADNTLSVVKAGYPNVKLVESAENLGFSKANNEALRYCSGDYVLLLNPDAFLNGIDQLLALRSRLDGHREIGAVGPKLVNPDGSHQVGDAGWRHNLPHSVSHFLFLHKLFGWKSLFISKSAFLKGVDVDVDWVCGACMLMRRDLITKIGGLDNGIFMYGEDVEWGVGIRELGKRVVYVPSVTVLHLQGAAQKSVEDVPYFSTKWLDALIQAVKKSTSGFGLLVFRFVAVAGFFVRSLLVRLGPRRKTPKARAQARNMLKYASHVWSMSMK